DQVLGGVATLEATPRDEQQAGDTVEEVERGEGVQGNAQARVLHDDHGKPPAEVRARRHTERRVLTRLADPPPAARELVDDRGNEGAGHPDEEVEAGSEQVINEPVDRGDPAHSRTEISSPSTRTGYTTARAGRSDSPVLRS